MSFCPDEWGWMDDAKSVQEPYDNDAWDTKNSTLDDSPKIVGDGDEEDETLLVICDETLN
jgi:hypothetical protein